MINVYELNKKKKESRHLSQESAEAKSNQDDALMVVRHVSKKFCRRLRRSMAYGIADLSKNLLGMKPDTSTPRIKTS